MKVSVVTPTEERPSLLHQLHTLLEQQIYMDWEWLIYLSFVYRASVGKACRFPDFDITKDVHFFEQVESHPFMMQRCLPTFSDFVKTNPPYMQ